MTFPQLNMGCNGGGGGGNLWIWMWTESVEMIHPNICIIYKQAGGWFEWGVEYSLMSLFSSVTHNQENVTNELMV